MNAVIFIIDAVLKALQEENEHLKHMVEAYKKDHQ